MRSLLKKLVSFSLPVLLIFIVFELFYRLIPNDYSVKYEEIPKKLNKTELLFLGNSHTFYGLNPRYFNRPAYNLAHISQTIYFDQLLFNQYINQFGNLKCVVLNIEYTSLSEIVETEENKWRKYYYQTYMHLDVPSIKSYDLTKYFISSTRTFNANSKLIAQYLKDGTIAHCDQNGFGTNYKKSAKKPLLEKDALIRVKNIEDGLMNFTDNISRIQSMIDACKKRNIKVLLLNMPVTKYFSDNVNPVKLKKIQNTCKIITSKNANVYNLNLFTDKRFTLEDFYDADHLDTGGAAKCSRIVNDFTNRVIFNNKK